MSGNHPVEVIPGAATSQRDHRPLRAASPVASVLKVDGLLADDDPGSFHRSSLHQDPVCGSQDAGLFWFVSLSVVGRRVRAHRHDEVRMMTASVGAERTRVARLGGSAPGMPGGSVTAARQGKMGTVSGRKALKTKLRAG